MIYSSLFAIAQLSDPNGLSIEHVRQALELPPGVLVDQEMVVADVPSTDLDLQPVEQEEGSAADQEIGPSKAADETAVIVVTVDQSTARIDPLQDANRTSYEVVRSVDEAVTGPLAREYKKTIPEPVRDGLRNFLSNLAEPVVAVNYLLQLKPGKTLETVGRFAVNTTAGVGGLFDVARRRPINLPRRENGFANTLGYYGVGPGPYMYLPLIGPTTVRDLVGRVGDVSLVPLTVGGPFRDASVVAPATMIRLIDQRAEADESIEASRAENADPYSFIRFEYLKQREAQIDELKGIERMED
ncbi:MlaA family lipoprotein [Aurantiacibacter flavus]|uniref:VacJ family lipoprotein n=1 Tax=Aurantiacibacter flavus TaxID=3145232 RepID=A0ABV0D1A6_9SPHN